MPELRPNPASRPDPAPHLALTLRFAPTLTPSLLCHPRRRAATTPSGSSTLTQTQPLTHHQTLIQTPGSNNAIRIINQNTVEFPFDAWVRYP